jgi:phosphoglycolate phosphatase
MTAQRFRAVLFDMDGTLVDTVPDIASALNAALSTNGLNTLPVAKIADLVGKGARVLIKRALSAQGLDDDRVQATVFDDYVREYAERVGREGRKFPGAGECLRGLHKRQIKTAVVTNALQRFADATLSHYGLARHLNVVIGGDRTAMPKPHPAPLWFACRTLHVSPAETLMVGDSGTDVAAARAAGCSVVCVPYGYNEGRPVAELDCEIIDNLRQVLAYVDAGAAPRQLPSSAA